MRIDVEPLSDSFLNKGRVPLLEQARKVVEEAFEVEATISLLLETESDAASLMLRESAKEEAVDVITAAMNLLHLMGVGQSELDCINELVHAKNERRGRY